MAEKNDKEYQRNRINKYIINNKLYTYIEKTSGLHLIYSDKKRRVHNTITLTQKHLYFTCKPELREYKGVPTLHFMLYTININDK